MTNGRERLVLRRDTPPQLCEYFYLCNEYTSFEIHNPILGWIRCCERCATTAGILTAPDPDPNAGDAILDAQADQYLEDILRDGS